MKFAALAIVAAPLVLAACATTRPNARVLDAHAQRAAQACVGQAWLHAGIAPNWVLYGPQSAAWHRHRTSGLQPVLGPPDIGRIVLQCH